MLGAWSLIRDSKPIWLLQIDRVEGTAGNGYGALFLLDSRRDKAERLVGAEKGLEGWVPAGEVDQIRFQMRIADGRYLLYSALVNKEIRLYDIEKQRGLNRIPVPTDSDLQIDLRVTKDLRHVLQVNSDGQFFLYETATAKRLLSGWFVDDEMLVYTQEGYFWRLASYRERVEWQKSRTSTREPAWCGFQQRFMKQSSASVIPSAAKRCAETSVGVKISPSGQERVVVVTVPTASPLPQWLLPCSPRDFVRTWRRATAIVTVS